MARSAQIVEAGRSPPLMFVSTKFSYRAVWTAACRLGEWERWECAGEPKALWPFRPERPWRTTTDSLAGGSHSAGAAC